jgi:hypothetical protein
MNVYIFQAALLCEHCGEQARACTPLPAGFDPENESTWDSDDYPKGPFSGGGGEADTPQHCDSCGTFLENPLTSDGVSYVAEALESDCRNDTIRQWAEFYGPDYPELEFTQLT